MKLGKWTLEVENDRVLLKEKRWLKAAATPNKEGEGYVVTTCLADGNIVKCADDTSKSHLFALLKCLKFDDMSQEDLHTVINLLSSALAAHHVLKVGSRICLPVENLTPIEITFTKGDKAFILVIYIDTKKKKHAGLETVVSYLIGPDGAAVAFAKGDAILDKLSELVEA